VRRPFGVTIIAVMTFFGAAILGLGSFALFFLGFMGMTGGDSAEPSSVAIAGMGISGGFFLLVLAGVAASLGIGVLKLREWAWIVCVASIAAGVGCTILSLFASKAYSMIPDVPSIYCHLFLLSTSLWMFAYLLLPRVKLAFSGVTA
jgi:hypothetical protein